MGFTFPVRVYYEDTDAGGVVYHANYLNFYERARTEFLRSLGFEQDRLLAQDIAFVVSRAEVDYLIAAKFNNLLSISVTIKQLKKASMTFEQQIIDQDGNLISKATVVVVCVNRLKMKPIAIPKNITKELSSAS